MIFWYDIIWQKSFALYSSYRHYLHVCLPPPLFISFFPTRARLAHWRSLLSPTNRRFQPVSSPTPPKPNLHCHMGGQNPTLGSGACRPLATCSPGAWRPGALFHQTLLTLALSSPWSLSPRCHIFTLQFPVQRSNHAWLLALVLFRLLSLTAPGFPPCWALATPALNPHRLSRGETAVVAAARPGRWTGSTALP